MSSPQRSNNTHFLNISHWLLLWHDWLSCNIYELARQLRWSYLPPLMIYFAAGVAGVTGIVGTFFVKEYLSLSAEFLATLGFWVMLPWALKMPLGHLVDLLWRYKSGLIYLGAAFIAASLLIMTNLLADLDYMRQVMPAEHWFILASMLAPTGYVMQDIVADAMTVEAVARFDQTGGAIPQSQIKLAHTTMQTLGRVAIICGSMLDAAANVYWFRGVESMDVASKVEVYLTIYHWALLIPVASILGVLLSSWLRSQEEWRLAAQGYEFEDIDKLLGRPATELPAVNWSLLGGGLGFTLFSVLMGLMDVSHSEEIVFAGSLAIVLFLMWQLSQGLTIQERQQLFGTALVIFAFRAAPTSGAGETWWMIDELQFDQQFLSQLSLINSALTLLGMILLRRFMAERSITHIITVLTVALTLLYLPNIALFYGVHEWTKAQTSGVLDARFIALVDTALESPLGQVAMIPMLAWIANSAPERLKATYFAVMAAFINLALSLSQLLTKTLNQWFVITREVKDPTGAVLVLANYSELGGLLFSVMLLSLALPLLAIVFSKRRLLEE